MVHSARRVRVIAATVSAAGIALLTACGGDGPEKVDVAPIAQIASESSPPAENGIDQLAPDDALASAIDAMEAAETFTVRGTTKAGSTIDMAFQVGVGAQGTVTTDSVVNLVAASGSVYVAGDPAAIADKIGADVDETIADKWLLVPPDSTSGFRIFTGASAFAESVLGSSAPTEVSSVREVDGQPAVGLLFPATGATLWVSASGDPVPLRFEEKGASAGNGVLTFADYGAEVSITEPAPETVVDPSAD